MKKTYSNIINGDLVTLMTHDGTLYCSHSGKGSKFWKIIDEANIPGLWKMQRTQIKFDNFEQLFTGLFNEDESSKAFLFHLIRCI